MDRISVRAHVGVDNAACRLMQPSGVSGSRSEARSTHVSFRTLLYESQERARVVNRRRSCKSRAECGARRKTRDSHRLQAASRKLKRADERIA